MGDGERNERTKAWGKVFLSFHSIAIYYPRKQNIDTASKMIMNLDFVRPLS